MNLVSALKVTATTATTLIFLKILGDVELKRQSLEARLANSEARARVLERTLIDTTHHLRIEDVRKVRSTYETELEFERLIKHVK